MKFIANSSTTAEMEKIKQEREKVKSEVIQKTLDTFLQFWS